MNMTPKSGDALTRWKVIAAGLSALILTVGLARFAYTPLLPIMRAQAGLDVVTGGWLATWNYAGYMSGALLAANVARLETKFRLYRLGLIVAVLTTLAMGFTSSPVIWGMLRFLSGVSSVAGMLLASGLVLNWLIREGHRPELGLHFMGIGAGIAISGLAVELISQHLNWSGTWIGLGVFGLAFLCCAWGWLPAPGQMPKGTTASAGASPSKRWLTLLAISYFCAGYGYVVSATFIVDLVDRLPAFEGHGGWVWTLVGIAAVPASFIWDAIARRTGSIQALMAAYTIQALSIVLPVITGNAIWVWTSALLFGVTFVGIVSLTLSLVGRHNPENPAKAMAKLTLSYGVAQILGPVATGLLSAHFGSYSAALLLVTVIMLIGISLLGALVRLK